VVVVVGAALGKGSSGASFSLASMVTAALLQQCPELLLERAMTASRNGDGLLLEARCSAVVVVRCRLGDMVGFVFMPVRGALAPAARKRIVGSNSAVWSMAALSAESSAPVLSSAAVAPAPVTHSPPLPFTFSGGCARRKARWGFLPGRLGRGVAAQEGET
jgi:hypothetical protein